MNNLNMNFLVFFKNRERLYTILLVYIGIILGFLIKTVNFHKKEDVEHFSIMSSPYKYSKCKDKCLLKYNDDKDKLKTCKSYCKCKKKCSMSLTNNKKCKSQCKEKKMNLYRDDETKMEKIEIKQKLKKEIKDKKKKEKIKLMEFEQEQQKQNEEEKEKSQGYLNRIINNYFSESDKEYLINMNRGGKKFKTDVNKVFSKYFK